MTRPAAPAPRATLLSVGLDVPGATFCASLDAAASCLRDARFELLLAAVPAADLLAWPALSHAVLDTTVVALLPGAPDEATQQQLLARGVQDIVVSADAPADALRRRLEIAAQRKALERAASRAHATDLATGLPNHAQLLEHLTHLVALREREPAPMALIALRIEGLPALQRALGDESANVLRRKVAVRLRASLRASDVVASIGHDAFAVLLAFIDSPGDGERVSGKLASVLRQPFAVAGRDAALAIHVGLALYPDHGRSADALLRRAVGQAASLPTEAILGAPVAQRGAEPAANDGG